MKNIESTCRIASLLLLTFLLLIIACPIYSKTYRIKWDGFGDFVTITGGINAAVHGDTLLVYPGRYIENLNYNGKNITITSLYGIESSDRRYIRETIIDGNQDGTVVLFRNGETREAVINGFTITNGSGYYYIGGDSVGGGIFIYKSSPVVSNCIVEFNNARNCGGIQVDDGKPFLAGNTIRYNKALNNVGGVRGDNVQFCSENLNSIYLNNAGYGVIDLGIRITAQQHVIIDTFTVMGADPEEIFILSINRDKVPEDFVFTVLNAKIEPVAADLYVSVDGCNSNDGLTPDTPLQTIAYAMSKIEPPCGNKRRNIHVLNGLYSASLNNQMFPVKVRSNINIIGESKKDTILDVENQGWAYSAYITPYYGTYRSNFSIKNFTIRNGGQDEYKYITVHSGMKLYYAKDFEIKNIVIHNGNTTSEAIWAYYITDFQLRNMEITNCTGSQGIMFGIGGDSDSEELFFDIENLRINNFTYPPNPPLERYGMSLVFHYLGLFDKPITGIITNLEITDGVVGMVCPFWGQYPYSNFMCLNLAAESPPRKLKIINATICNNSAPGRAFGGGMYFEGGVDAEIINSIIWRNTPGNITVHNPKNNQMDIKFSHSILGGGIDGILRYGASNANIHWGEGCLTDDPLLLEYYRLSENSPARGAGTLDIPDFEFPEYDLAGNPRIVNGRIDMGAYQWHPYQPPTGVEESDLETKGLREGNFNLRNFPNPATTLLNHSTAGVEGHRSSTTGTNIAFELPESGRVMIEIYNLKGQFVKRVYDAYIPKGEHNVFWDGRNEKGQFVATGFYMYNLHFNEQLVATGRATFIK